MGNAIQSMEDESEDISNVIISEPIEDKKIIPIGKKEKTKRRKKRGRSCKKKSALLLNDYNFERSYP